MAFRCQHYGGTAAAAQKVLALAGRPVTQARDVFDLDVLRRGGYTEQLELSTLVTDEQRAAALENVRALGFDDFAGQVLEFLEEDQRVELDQAAWRTMVAHVEGLLSPR